MALTDSTKVDYLWKKVGYGLTKTDTPENKEAFNESIASPLLIRGDKVWAESGNIPAVQPTTGNTSVVAIYNDSGNGAATVECTEDITASDNRTWKTGITDWISPEFGSTYLVKVYVANSSVSNPQSVGTQLFQAGSGSNDEWFFDYQSGVLNFNGANIPSDIATGITGKSVYVAGAVYIGDFGVGSGTTLGNLQVNDTTITTVNANANIILEPDGTGTVQINSTSSFTLPTGNTSQRPASADSGAIRYNSETTNIEFYDGSDWTNVAEGGTIESQTISPDGSTTQFDLDRDTTADAVLVTLNGVSQIPNSSYSVTGNVITFTETPTTDDIIEVRFFGVTLTASGTGTVSNSTAQQIAYYPSTGVTVQGSGSNLTWNGSDTLTVTGNVEISGDIKSDSFYFVKRSTDTNITYPGSYGSVTIDYEDAGDDYNSTDAMWSSVTDRFTPTVAGLWYFRASADTYSGATQESGIYIEKNGTSVAATGHIGAIRPQVVTHLYMNGTTDYVQFRAYAQSSTTRGQSAPDSFFEALLVKQAE